ncbi:MAG: choice-of-anchor L domain-containing protein, partial [Flavobacteriales bacterium]|nr:choice-of-anchor L domain-containing protein [Flavobacteriales bacterium]
MKKFFITLSIIGSASAVRQGAWSQLTLTTQTANQYVANLVGNGITYSNVVFNGDPAAIRAFSNGNTTNLGLTSGVVMSTGLLNGTGTQSLSGPSSNFLSGNNGGGSYPELNAIAGSATYDGLVLEFDFVPVTNQLNVEFVFGSEEYNEYVNSGFNDAFAFFISGPGIVGQQNIALVPNTSLPVTIDNINNGNWWWCSFGPCFNCAYYIDNCNGTTLAMDGFTTVLTASRTVIPCSTYHIRLMIADGGDAAYDSWVFLKQDGFYSVGATGASVTTTTLIPGGTAFEGCGNNVNYFTFSIPAPVSTNTTINFTIGGTATNGLDYQAIPNSITIPAGQTSANLFINAINDGIVEPNETVILTVPLNACSTQTYTLTIADPVPLNVNVPPNVSYCAGGPPVSITATPSGGLGNISYSWSNGAGTGQTISVNPGSTTTYTVTATDACGTTATAQTTVAVVPAPSSAFSMPSTGCVGQPVTITYTGNAPPGATYNWNFGAATVQSGSGQGPYTVTFPNTGSFNVSLTVIHNGCTSATTTQNIQISNAFTSTFSAPANICAGQTATITYTGNAPANATYNWNFGGGTVLSGSGQGPYQVQFNTPGTPTITLSVASGSCTSSTTSVPITVNQIPTSTFTVTSPVCVGQNATVTYTGNGGNASVYNWNFAGGNAVPGWGMGPHQVSWNAPGTYTITLTTNLNGCISPPTSVNVDVISAPTSTFSISPNPPCAGQNVTVTYTGNASAGATYSWNFGGGVIVSGSGQGPYVINFPSAQNYNISLQVNQGGCISTTTTQTVAVTQPPTSSFTTSSPICFGQNLTVNYTGNAPPGATYNWNFGGATVVSGNGPGPYNLSFPSPGSYTLSLQVNNNGCQSNTTTQNVVVNPGPSASFAVNPGTLCEGQAATVTYTGNAGAGATYTWNFGGGTVQSGSGAGPYQVSWATGGNYTVSLTVTQNGCTSTPATQAVTVNAIPTASFSLNPATVCAGQPVTITYTGSAGAGAVYNWDFGGGTVQSGSGAGPYQVSWTAGGSFSVSLSVTANGCTSPPNNQNVTINSIPTSSFTATSGICPGQNSLITYTGTAGPGATYNWSFSGGTVASGSGPGPYQVNWLAPGTYTISLTVIENGCTSSSTTQQVVVSNLPSAAFSINPNPVCVNQPVTITYTGGANNATFSWNFGGGIVQSGSGGGPYTVIYNTANTFTVSLQVNVGGCLSPPQTQTITVNPIPTSSFSMPVIACAQNPVTITYTGNAGAGATYNWSFDMGTVVSGSGQGPYQVEWSQVGVYIVSLQVIENGCVSATTALSIGINPTPVASFSVNPSPACVGQPVTITYTGNSPPNVSYTYNFPGGNIISGIGQGPFQVIWPNAGTYNLTLMVIASGCTSQVFNYPLTVNNPPTSSFTVNPNAVCAGQSVTITYSGNAGANASFNWDFGGGTIISGSGTGPYQVQWPSAGAPNITLTVTENGCTSTPTSLPVTVYPIPSASFTASSPLCPGQLGTISYTGTASPVATYAWNFGGGTVVSGTGQGPYQVHWNSPGNYSVSLTVTENGCISPPYTQNVVVHSTPLSTFSVPNAACEDQPVTITYTGTSSPGATYSWNFGGGTILSGSGQGPYQVSWPNSGTATVSLTVIENGCPSFPTTQSLLIHPIPSATF